MSDRHSGEPAYRIPPEQRAKIAEGVRRHYANNPEAQARRKQSAQAGGRATTSRKAALEAENARLREQVAALQAEVERLTGATAPRESDARIRANARAETSEVTEDPTTARGDAIAAHRTSERAR